MGNRNSRRSEPKSEQRCENCSCHKSAPHPLFPFETPQEFIDRQYKIHAKEIREFRKQLLSIIDEKGVDIAKGYVCTFRIKDGERGIAEHVCEELTRSGIKSKVMLCNNRYYVGPEYYAVRVELGRKKK